MIGWFITPAGTSQQVPSAGNSRPYGFQTKFREVRTGTSTRRLVPWCPTSTRSGVSSPRLEDLQTIYKTDHPCCFMNCLPSFIVSSAELGRLYGEFPDFGKLVSNILQAEHQLFGTWSYSLLQIEVNLFLCLHSKDIVLHARHILGCFSVIADLGLGLTSQLKRNVVSIMR